MADVTTYVPDELGQASSEQFMAALGALRGLRIAGFSVDFNANEVNVECYALDKQGHLVVGNGSEPVTYFLTFPVYAP